MGGEGTRTAPGRGDRPTALGSEGGHRVGCGQGCGERPAGDPEVDQPWTVAEVACALAAIVDPAVQAGDLVVVHGNTKKTLGTIGAIAGLGSFGAMIARGW